MNADYEEYEKGRDEVSLPEPILLDALREYYAQHVAASAAESDLLDIAGAYSNSVRYLSRLLENAFGNPFEFEHLIGGADSSGGSAASSTVSAASSSALADNVDPRLGHPLCPPS
jgi:hypothetical protein